MDVPQAAIEAVSTFGTVMVFIMLSAQLPAMYTVVTKTKSVQNLSPIPTIGQMSNFVTWTIYALPPFKGDAALLRVNALGIGFGLGYIAIFMLYATGANRRLLYMLLAGFVLVTGALEAIFITVASGDTRLTLMASFSVACNVAMFAAPIAQLRVAFSLMNPAALPMLLCLANTITSATWMTYGLFVGNWFVAGPNVAGCALNLMQLVAGGYISLRAMQDPSIVKPLPGAAGYGKGKEDDEGEDGDGVGLLAGLREDPAEGVATRYTALPQADV